MTFTPESCRKKLARKAIRTRKEPLMPWSLKTSFKEPTSRDSTSMAYALDDAASKFLSTLPIVMEDLRNKILHQIKTCLDRYTTSHKLCGTRTVNFPPKRLIDVGNTRTPMRLYQAQHDNAVTYVALSYRWGGKQCIITTRATVQFYTQELPIEALSKGIRDAIMITRDLGFRYLWVDALCIVQDNVDDKISKINKMGLVYRKAI
jgi:hypothetical protein